MDEQNVSALGFGDGEAVIEADGAQEQVVSAPGAVEGDSEPAGAATPQPDTEDLEQEVVPAPQSREWNDAMKQARVSGKHEAERAINDVYTRRLLEAGITNPITGKPFANLDEFANYSDTLAANNAGLTLNQFREQREEQERLREKAAELDTVKAELAQVKISGELAELKKQFPEISKAKSVLELGEDFIRMRAAGVAPDVAYLAVKGAKDAKTKPAPSGMGGLSRQGPEREYFTSEELDALTQAQLEDPATLEKAMKSMEMLGKK